MMMMVIIIINSAQSEFMQFTYFSKFQTAVSQKVKVFLFMLLHQASDAKKNLD